MSDRITGKKHIARVKTLMHSLDSLRTSPLVLHNFLHSVSLSTGMKKILKITSSGWLLMEFPSRSHFFHISAHFRRFSGENSQHSCRFFGESRRGKFCYGKQTAMRNCSAEKSMQHWAKFKWIFLCRFDRRENVVQRLHCNLDNVS